MYPMKTETVSVSANGKGIEEADSWIETTDDKAYLHLKTDTIMYAATW